MANSATNNFNVDIFPPSWDGASNEVPSDSTTMSDEVAQPGTTSGPRPDGNKPRASHDLSPRRTANRMVMTALPGKPTSDERRVIGAFLAFLSEKEISWNDFLRQEQGIRLANIDALIREGISCRRLNPATKEIVFKVFGDILTDN